MDEEPPLLPPEKNGNRRFALRVVVLALAAVVVGELTVTIGRGILCSLKGGCDPGEWSNAVELLSGLLATLVALIFALIEGRKP
jgi:hypothetical protein